MNKRESRKLVGRLSTKLFFQLIFCEIVYLLVLWGGLFLAMVLCNQIIWQPNNPIYWILAIIEENIILIMLLLTVGGVLAILYYFWRRTVSYLEMLIEASSILVDHKEDTQISLPPDLAMVEQKMNSMKTESQRLEKAAKEAEQRKNDLIVYLAHDLKTPLTSVIGYLTLLHDETEISRPLQNKYLSIALEKAERLENLINEFFEITRFNLTTLSLEAETVNLTRMLQQLLWEFKPLADEKDIQFDLQLDGQMEVRLDVNKMERVFDNLVRNALNYSYEHAVIQIEARLQKDGIYMRFENDGKTIPPEKLTHLFEQFYRADSARGTKQGGAGLGLAISKEIVELHKGWIKAESENEKIIFTLFIPQPL